MVLRYEVDMSGTDIFLIVIRWLHILASAVWVGGGLFYLFVIRPAIKRDSEAYRGINKAIGIEFKTVVNTCIIVITVTGVLLVFDRLTEDATQTPYVIILAIKIVMALWMFIQVHVQQRKSEFLEAFGRANQPMPVGLRRLGRAVSGYNLVIIIGVVVFLLSDVLGIIFEEGLR